MLKNIAVIGCGYWGKNLVRCFYDLGVLRTICDESELALKDMACRHSDVKCVRNITDVLRDELIRGVVIATPAARHYELVKLSLEAGKDVFVEKPLALKLEEGEALAKIAEDHGQILMVGHILEYHPAIEKLMEIVQKGELGDICYIYSNRLSLGRLRREENVLWSFAPHDISVILSLIGEIPTSVNASGGAYLSHDIADVTLSALSFPSGIRAHIFVSWLHPFKEQRLVVVGSKKMAVFNDMDGKNKLILYPHKAYWDGDVSIVVKNAGERIDISSEEPLKLECQHFLQRVADRGEPRTGAKNGLEVLRVLDRLQKSLSNGGKMIAMNKKDSEKYFAHETAVIDDGAEIGDETKIWHFSHIMSGAKIGKRCNIGQNVVVLPKCVVGDNVKIQNNVSVYTGVYVEDGAFLGPSMVFTNVYNPRGFIERKHEYRDTYIKRGATIGANATVVCGHTIGEYSFVGAGSVITKDVPPHALVYGNPACIQGWVCCCGWKLPVEIEYEGSVQCKECGSRYSINNQKITIIEQKIYASATTRS